MPEYKGPPDQAHIDKTRVARMAMIDEFDPPIRSLIHEYGLASVKALWDVGVRKPNQIKHVIETVLNEFSPTRGSYSLQGPRRMPTDDHD